MLRVRRVVAWVVFVVGALVGLLGGTARAQAGRPQSLHILEIDSDDSDEQAEALTGAMRSHVRTAPGWVLLDTTQSLSMLTAALRCPPRPDTACLQRIGDQLKTDRFVWGLISKTGGRQVTADIHLWARGKPDQSIKENYSDNLKDQNDDTLKKIATRFFERLTGSPAATVTVHVTAAGAPGVPWAGEGTIVADDNQKGPIEHGVATVVLSGGTHVLEGRATGFTAASQSVVATTGTNQDLSFELAPQTLAAPEPTTPTSNRKTVAWATLIGGGVVLVASGVLGIVFESERSQLNSDRNGNYGAPTLAPISDPCAANVPSAATQAAAGCSAHNTAQVAEIAMIASFGAGAALATTGIWLLTTSHTEGQPPAPTMGLRGVKLVPEFGPHGGSLGLSGAF